MEDAEALRRRLYAPGAGAEDVAAYRGSAPAGGPASARRVLVTVGAVVTALAVLVTAAALLLPPRKPPAPAATPVALSAADRVELRTNLESGGAAGIAAYLVTHRSPAGLRGATAVVTQERDGTGPAVLRLDQRGALDRGRATVLLVTAASGAAGWAALPRSGPPVRRTQDLPPGTLTATTLRYDGAGRPVRLRIDVGDGVRWGAAVVFSR